MSVKRLLGGDSSLRHFDPEAVGMVVSVPGEIINVTEGDALRYRRILTDPDAAPPPPPTEPDDDEPEEPEVAVRSWLDRE